MGRRHCPAKKGLATRCELELPSHEVRSTAPTGSHRVGRSWLTGSPIRWIVRTSAVWYRRHSDASDLQVPSSDLRAERHIARGALASSSQAPAAEVSRGLDRYRCPGPAWRRAKEESSTADTRHRGQVRADELDPARPLDSRQPLGAGLCALLVRSSQARNRASEPSPTRSCGPRHRAEQSDRCGGGDGRLRIGVCTRPASASESPIRMPPSSPRQSQRAGCMENKSDRGETCCVTLEQRRCFCPAGAAQPRRVPGGPVAAFTGERACRPADVSGCLWAKAVTRAWRPWRPHPWRCDHATLV